MLVRMSKRAAAAVYYPPPSSLPYPSCRAKKMFVRVHDGMVMDKTYIHTHTGCRQVWLCSRSREMSSAASSFQVGKKQERESLQLPPRCELLLAGVNNRPTLSHFGLCAHTHTHTHTHSSPAHVLLLLTFLFFAAAAHSPSCFAGRLLLLPQPHE